MMFHEKLYIISICLQDTSTECTIHTMSTTTHPSLSSCSGPNSSSPYSMTQVCYHGYQKSHKPSIRHRYFTVHTKKITNIGMLPWIEISHKPSMIYVDMLPWIQEFHKPSMVQVCYYGYKSPTNLQNHTGMLPWILIDALMLPWVQTDIQPVVKGMCSVI